MVYHPYQLAPKVGAIYKEVAHVLLHCHLALLLLGVGLPPTAWNSGPRHRVISAKYPEGAVRLVVLEQLEEEEEQWKVVEVDVAGFERRPYTGYLERSAPPLLRRAFVFYSGLSFGFPEMNEFKLALRTFVAKDGGQLQSKKIPGGKTFGFYCKRGSCTFKVIVDISKVESLGVFKLDHAFLGHDCGITPAPFHPDLDAVMRLAPRLIPRNPVFPPWKYEERPAPKVEEVGVDGTIGRQVSSSSDQTALSADSDSKNSTHASGPKQEKEQSTVLNTTGQQSETPKRSIHHPARNRTPSPPDQRELKRRASLPLAAARSQRARVEREKEELAPISSTPAPSLVAPPAPLPTPTPALSPPLISAEAASDVIKQEEEEEEEVTIVPFTPSSSSSRSGTRRAPTGTSASRPLQPSPSAEKKLVLALKARAGASKRGSLDALVRLDGNMRSVVSVMVSLGLDFDLLAEAFGAGSKSLEEKLEKEGLLYGDYLALETVMKNC